MCVRSVLYLITISLLLSSCVTIIKIEIQMAKITPPINQRTAKDAAQKVKGLKTSDDTNLKASNVLTPRQIWERAIVPPDIPDEAYGNQEDFDSQIMPQWMDDLTDYDLTSEYVESVTDLLKQKQAELEAERKADETSPPPTESPQEGESGAEPPPE